MKTQHFIAQVEKDRLVQAIQKAQQGNAGDIVLLVTAKQVADAMPAAHDAFRRLALEKKVHPHAVLIFLAPESQRLAVIGGTEIYKKLPPPWWQELVAEISASFQQQQLTAGLESGILKIGAALQEHFPTTKNIDRADQTDFVQEEC